jgi:hypothetical protein
MVPRTVWFISGHFGVNTMTNLLVFDPRETLPKCKLLGKRFELKDHELCNLV